MHNTMRCVNAYMRLRINFRACWLKEKREMPPASCLVCATLPAAHSCGVQQHHSRVTDSVLFLPLLLQGVNTSL